jgi:hypothetical protein
VQNWPALVRPHLGSFWTNLHHFAKDLPKARYDYAITTRALTPDSSSPFLSSSCSVLVEARDKCLRTSRQLRWRPPDSILIDSCIGFILHENSFFLKKIFFGLSFCSFIVPLHIKVNQEAFGRVVLVSAEISSPPRCLKTPPQRLYCYELSHVHLAAASQVGLRSSKVLTLRPERESEPYPSAEALMSALLVLLLL